MACKFMKKAGTIVLFGPILVFWFFTGFLDTAQADHFKTEGYSPLAALSLDKGQIMEKPTVKVLPRRQIRVPANIADRKADLVCTIKAYYDENRTRPVQNHVWHLDPGWYTPPLPLPWHVYWDVEIMNNGTEKAEDFSAKINFVFDGSDSSYRFLKATLAPGESAIFKFNYGPFGPPRHPRNILVELITDTTGKIDELNEGKNKCGSVVRFVYP